MINTSVKLHEHILISKDEVEELTQGWNIGSVEIKSLEILSRSEIVDIASITFKAELKYDMGDSIIISKHSWISVYLKENNEYICIYDAGRFQILWYSLWVSLK